MTTGMILKKVIDSVVRVIVATYIIAGLPAVVLALLLVMTAETAGGRLFGLAVTVAFPVPVLLWFSGFLGKWRRRVRGAAFGLAGLALLVLVVCAGLTPDGRPLPGACASSVYAGEVSYCRASAANLVPEIDQFKLGSYLVEYLDPFVDHARSIRIRRLFLDVYRPMGASPEFACLGSCMNWAYRDLFMNRHPPGQLYVYVPAEERHPGRRPVLLFVHGSLGNFKGYLWVWKRLADEQGFAIVAPGFGAGNWDVPGGVETVEMARQYCVGHPRMDSGRIYLAGLSNGGMGATRAAAANPDGYRGLILISPVMETEVIGSPAFVAGWKNRRILVLHGAEDERIPCENVRADAAQLKWGGAAVQAEYCPGEDHFLLFSSWAWVHRHLAAWLQESGDIAGPFNP